MLCKVIIYVFVCRDWYFSSHLASFWDLCLSIHVDNFLEICAHPFTWITSEPQRNCPCCSKTVRGNLYDKLGRLMIACPKLLIYGHKTALMIRSLSRIIIWNKSIYFILLFIKSFNNYEHMPSSNYIGRGGHPIKMQSYVCAHTLHSHPLSITSA